MEPLNLDYEIIYKSDNLLIKSCLFEDSGACIVTFGSYTDDFNLDREGFGEEFFKKNRISAVHIINGNNIWYNYPNFNHAIECINKKVSRFKKIITYGSSMGGFGAIFYAEKLNAEEVIAISPQYHIAPKIVKFENRWDPLIRENNLLREGYIHGSDRIKPVVIYDPLDLDRLHYLLIKKYYPKAREIKIKHSGHPCGAYLEETGFLKNIILSVVNGNLKINELTFQIRNCKNKSAHYYFNLARRLKTHHLSLKSRLIEKAIELRNEPAFYLYSAILAEVTGNLALAEHRYNYANKLQENNIIFSRSLAFYFFRQKRYSEAYNQSETLVQQTDQFEIKYFHAVILFNLSKFDEFINYCSQLKVNFIKAIIFRIFLQSWPIRQYIAHNAYKIYGLKSQMNLLDEAKIRVKNNKKIRYYSNYYGKS